MKSEELSRIFKGISEILDLYPGEDINFILNDLRKIKKEKTGNNHRIKDIKKDNINNKSNEEINKNIDEIFINISRFSIEEIEKKLLDENIFPTINHLKYFASKLGLDIKSKSSRNNLIQSLKSYIDRTRIDETIRKRST